jgi:hypothetical protein
MTECFRRLIYCDSLSFVRAGLTTRMRGDEALFLRPQLTNNSFPRRHIESMAIDSIPWKPQCSIVSGVGDGDRIFSKYAFGYSRKMSVTSVLF